ncbi:phage tail protein [Yersinia mollaretii]|uniref:phage tail protein n=1 Tax=Yersinia mollaretii TaxID=33060 RepID=UPI0011A621EA|nr:phage tail protein [Yersinia mollaretii]
MTAKFFALLTNIGAAKLANATALGTRLEITQMAVGDGGGTLPTPNPAQTQLVNEQRRAALNTLSIDPINTSQIIAEQVIPEAEGGWWIREIGLLDKDGDLIAVANCAETYKPLMQEGSGRTQTIRVILIVSSTAAVTLKIDPSVVLATRKYVDDKAIEVKTYVDDLMEKHLAATDPHSRYAPKASPVLTGKPTAPTAAKTDNSTQLATTAHVKQSLADYAPLASPALTGTPTTPTPEVGSNTQQVASAAFVQAAISALVASSPTTLNTLKKLADALGNDPDFATTMTEALAAKMDKAKNGGDIPDVAKFLTNLGLGDAAKLGAANNTQMAAGISTTLLPTVAAVMSLFAKRSFAVNDYIRIPDVPGGLIIQWMTGASTVTGDQDQTITFPTPFPTLCLRIFVSTFGGSPNLSDGWFQERIGTTTTTCLVNSQFTGSSVAGGITPRVLAIGY